MNEKSDDTLDQRDAELLEVLNVGASGARCCGRGLCCENNPGWFAPGEMELAAKHLGMSPEDFFAKYVVVVNVRLRGEPGQPLVEAYAPTKVDAKGEPIDGAGKRVSRVYQFMSGPCIFYQERRCAIHAARPTECRAYYCEQPDEMNLSKEQLGKLWLEAWKAKGTGTGTGPGSGTGSEPQGQ